MLDECLPTAVAKNKYLKTCHAHAHLYLGIETIQQFTILQRQAYPRNLYIMNLVGCYREPFNHQYEDALALQGSRLLISYINDIKMNIDSTDKGINILKSGHISHETQQHSMKVLNETHTSDTITRKKKEEKKENVKEKRTR
ncbi:unnamed protein product [Didymodactylos carnosus]|uniref:Uncharacterized protein n=1 Tax=Didymodactylos carnosus TaxID=1234261 RepID=A0A815N5B3_9BILA|nr:unnamed protein product [Didymodactylos carnosus]CAF1427356.1 unnamed protein product [Didymodactylos carnosus]CAF3589803.1 unnamed protein product [Didymodactylos carnosus]CAF4307426.1 unnamed protein product [Didymodactylos carnosus]